MDTNLAKRMINKADEDCLPEDHDMRTKAKAFEDAVIGYFSKNQTKTAQQVLGCFARARKCWSDYTGEPLI